MKKSILILSIILCSCSYRTKIIRCKDGDTVVTESKEVIRLSNIDAPEKAQPYGMAAKKYLESLILNKEVKIVSHGKDKYHRTLADIYINGMYVNEAMINAGFAWVYPQYSPNKYYLEELAAKQKRIGLWASNYQISPYQFRHKKY